MDPKELLPLFVASKVLKFKCKDFEIEFQAGSNIESVVQSVRAQENSLSPDLRADDLMNEKKVMEWSAPPSAEGAEPDMPLTGEAIL